jgi:hypothetical protein
VGPRTGLDAVEKREIEPGPSSPSLYRLSYPGSSTKEYKIFVIFYQILTKVVE